MRPKRGAWRGGKGRLETVLRGGRGVLGGLFVGAVVAKKGDLVVRLFGVRFVVGDDDDSIGNARLESSVARVVVTDISLCSFLESLCSTGGCLLDINPDSLGDGGGEGGLGICGSDIMLVDNCCCA